MLGGKSVLRRSRHRRVLSKSFRRVASLSITEGTTPNTNPFPRFGIAIFSVPLVYYVGLKFSVLLIAITLILRQYGVFRYLQSIFTTYRNRTPRHGPSIREKCYYYVDYWLSTNPYAKALVLMVLTWCLILTSGTLISWMASEPWIESLWAAALGSGLDWGFINSTSPSLRLIAVCTNVGGLVLTALLLSIISDAVQTKYDSLRKGESSVAETGHTLIIGWSVKSLSVMIQLAKAGESVGNNVIVCLSDQREKEDMENDIALCDFNFANIGTRVVCRSGSPLSYHDLRRVSFSQARSIIILGEDEHDAETNDARSLQVLLSIVSALERERVIAEKKKKPKERRDENSSCPRPERIVIEVMDTENAAIMTSVSPELVEAVLAHDVVGRLMLQAARNPLVADVWQELLGFDGCETYSGQWGILRGLCFREALLCFEDAIPLGVKTASGDLLLNPADSYVIAEGDEVIVLAEDDDTYCASITHTLIREAIQETPTSPVEYVDICPGGLEAIRTFATKWAKNPSLPLSHVSSPDLNDNEPERILFCGWRFDMGNMLQVYSAVAPMGSEFWILSEVPIEQRESELQLRGWECNNRVRVIHRVGDCRRSVLAQLPLESFSSVIVGASASGSEQYRSGGRSKGGSDNSLGSKSEVIGDADARVINVVMMIQDITGRRNQESVMDQEFCSLQSCRTPKSGRFGSVRSMSLARPGNHGLSRARSQRFLGAKPAADANFSRGVIVGEIVDSRSRAMLSVVNSIDAVVASSELISKAVAMVAEDGSVNKVLNTLFDPYDAEITLECADAYVDITTRERVSFFELMARGRELGTIVLGYLERELVPLDGDDTGTIRYTGVILNPPHKDLRRSWHPDDLLVVLTPGTSDSSVAPSDFLMDIAEVKRANISLDLAFGEVREARKETKTMSMSKRSKVRFIMT